MNVNTKNKNAVIFGAGGQDGYYLSKILLELSYDVFGTFHEKNTQREQILKKLGVKTLACDVNDASKISEVITSIKPLELYNLSGKSSVHDSWNKPLLYLQTNALSVVSMLEILTNPKLKLQHTKFFQASSSEIFGDTGINPANENNLICPSSPYAVSKAISHQTIQLYRNTYKRFFVSGILFNHESPLRESHFLSKKIVTGAVRIAKGQASEIRLANLDNRRDWSFAGDVMRAAWMMLQHKEPEDFIIASGQSKSIEEFALITFNILGIKNWEKYIKLDINLARKNNIKTVQADPSKAHSKLNWFPQFNFEQLVQHLVENELNS